MAMSFDSLRVGKKYILKNLGEKNVFTVQERKSNDDFIVKDVYTLEVYSLQDLVRYGKGKDFDLYEAM
ncbi:MAG: hypothetical protein ACJ75J_08970 [Cytophagaceae bacterium]